MTKNILKLLSNSSNAIDDISPPTELDIWSLGGALGVELLSMLEQKNGFYALEGALHVFPAKSVGDETGLEDWNASDFWRSAYEEMVEGCLFFAQDIFGGQFCIREGAVCTFDPETGEIEYLADNLDGWAEAIMSDYNLLTGYPLAHSWQLEHGAIESGMRLAPKIPFVLGGEFSVDNLYMADASKSLISRAEIAKQIRDLPDGAEITINLKDT